MSTNAETPISLDIRAILESLPHRYPLLLVDRALEIDPGKKIKALKNVTMNEAFFQGHFPGHPIMPGVLIVEAMAQAAALIFLSNPDYRHLLPLFGAIDNAKFKRPVTPGDQLIFEVETLWMRNMVGKVQAKASVDGQIAALAEITCKFVPKEI